MVDRADPINEPSHIGFRLTTLLFAVLLGAQCIWLLPAELSRPSLDELPTDAASAAAAAVHRDAARWAAFIGGIRGDLWAESGFTYADLLVGTDPDPNMSATLSRARASLDHALDNAPNQSGAWLLLAGLALRYPPAGVDATQALKMSYYTGPSERNLIPLRLRMAMQADKSNDEELRQLAGRDIRLLLMQKQNSAIVEAYKVASPDDKHFIEQTVGNLDPSALDALHATSSQLEPLPN